MCVHLFPHWAAQWLLYKAVPVFCCCIRKTTGQPPFNLIYRLNPFSRSHQHNRASSFWQVLKSITHVTVSTFPYIYICTTTFKTFNTKLYITWSRTLKSTEKMHAERAHWSTKPVGYIILCSLQDGNTFPIQRQNIVSKVGYCPLHYIYIKMLPMYLDSKSKKILTHIPFFNISKMFPRQH